MSDEISIEYRNATMILSFERPEIRNPLSIGVLDQLHALIDVISADDRANAVIFTGTGNSFASGADLREIATVSASDAPAFARYGQALMRKIAALEIPTFAAINGFCFGGALDLALACDFRVAVGEAKFAHPGTGLGIITGWGGTQRLPRLVGTAHALELFFTASPIDAEKALRIGLIDSISDDPVADSLAKISLLGSSY